MFLFISKKKKRKSAEAGADIKKLTFGHSSAGMSLRIDGGGSTTPNHSGCGETKRNNIMGD